MSGRARRDRVRTDGRGVKEDGRESKRGDEKVQEGINGRKESRRREGGGVGVKEGAAEEGVALLWLPERGGEEGRWRGLLLGRLLREDKGDSMWRGGEGKGAPGPKGLTAPTYVLFTEKRRPLLSWLCRPAGAASHRLHIKTYEVVTSAPAESNSGIKLYFLTSKIEKESTQITDPVEILHMDKRFWSNVRPSYNR